MARRAEYRRFTVRQKVVAKFYMYSSFNYPGIPNLLCFGRSGFAFTMPM